MAAVERDMKRNGPAERAAAIVPPPAGRAFRFVVVPQQALCTAALVAIAALVALKTDIAGVKSETASFHADVTKQMTAMGKGLSDTANQVNSATLELNDIALSLHKKP